MNEEIKTIRLGNVNGYTGGSFHGQVYDINGLSPALTCMSGGNTEPHIIIEDFYANRDIRIYEEYSPSIRSERSGLKVVESDKL